MISLIAFLGNHGRQYAGNRHNVAWLFADTVTVFSGLSWQSKFKGRYARYNDVHLIKPETYMNRSGESVMDLAAFFKITPEEILVVHDELELPLGTVSLKWSGGLGGHNGLRSMKQSFGTSDFWRLRFGIGRPQHPDVAGWVLSDFTQDEQITLSRIWQPAGELLASLLGRDPDPYLKEWSKKKLADGE